MHLVAGFCAFPTRYLSEQEICQEGETIETAIEMSIRGSNPTKGLFLHHEDFLKKTSPGGVRTWGAFVQTFNASIFRRADQIAMINGAFPTRRPQLFNLLFVQSDLV